MIKLNEFNENKLNKLFRENFRIIAPSYIKLLSEWMNSSYETFHDIDKYRIILYLINKDFEQYIKTNKVESYDNFFLYDKSLELDRINIIEISKSLNIPKESTRRKIIELEEIGVLQKTGKKIYIDRSAYRLVQPKNTLKNLSVLLVKISEIFENKKLINKSFNIDEMSTLIKDNFSYCWYYFYKFIFTLTTRWKIQLGDLETYSVGMVIVCHSISASDAPSKFEGKNLDFVEWNKNFLKNKDIGVNTMSISEITHIPRPTVVRKLAYLLKNDYIVVNKKKQFSINMQGKALNDTLKLQQQNFLSLSYLISKIFEQIDTN